MEVIYRKSLQEKESRINSISDLYKNFIESHYLIIKDIENI